MPETLKVDRQGRMVIPQRERERLGVRDGGTLELVPTPEGLLLERRRRAEVRVADDGLPVVSVEELEEVSNDEMIEAIHRQRDRT
jgi:AbrB family looped-hinge helix DNA binding protein